MIKTKVVFRRTRKDPNKMLPTVKTTIVIEIDTSTRSASIGVERQMLVALTVTIQATWSHSALSTVCRKTVKTMSQHR